jgi:hydrogenase maturation protein HypF
MPEIVRQCVQISGVVQGVGFRPFIWRRATRLGLAGWVENDAAGVMLEVQGKAAAVAAFLNGLASSAPPLSSVGRIDVHDLPVQPGATTFAILASVAGGQRTAHVPPDIAPCPACLAEMADPHDRRHRYPFVNCTDCGPRFTIIEGLPYDRGRTTMRGFAMCPQCAAEYGNPGARRFHAEPLACPTCGPTMWYAPVADGPIPVSRPAAGVVSDAASLVGDAAIEAARDLLHRGGIIAIKGVGGFHLACDATNAAAVTLLRERKGRVGKPLAVMVGDVGIASQIAVVGEQERRLLEGRERPVVLLRSQPHRPGSGPRLADGVAPGIDIVGVMLPPTPLHQLLCAGLPPLVMTSGNLAEEPIAHADADATVRLAPLVDAFLLHDRSVHVPCDDSVVRCVAGGVTPIRRSRGYAPLPIRLAGGGPAMLAVGGELKAAICVARDDVAVMGQHVGDVATLETLDALDRTAAHLVSLFEITLEAVVADLHPGYLSADWAARFAASRGSPSMGIPSPRLPPDSSASASTARATAATARSKGASFSWWLEGSSPAPPTCRRSRCLGATRRSATRGERRWPSCMPPASTGTTSFLWPRQPPIAAFCDGNSSAASTARSPPAWAGCLTPSPPSRAWPHRSPTRPRPR